MTPSRKLSSPGGLPWPDGCPPERLSATARKAAEIASTILLEGLTRKIEVGFKGRINLVTEIDLASERAVIETISREFPGHGFLAEESGRTMPKEESPLRWIIDPLDGTTNYAHRYPCFCVSIAFEAAGTVLYGLVVDPLRKMWFEAAAGRGATLDGQPLAVSEETFPERSLLATGFSYTHADTPRLNNMATFEGFSREVQGIRRSGSAALDLCHVAMGVLDGFWERSLSPWDTAAATLIVREAGGTVTDGQGNPFRLDAPLVIASNGHVHRWMLETIRQIGEDPEQRQAPR
ncbi:MAG: inositol monophosphatase [Nitrospirae bacterium]|nr:inositol monophosphatase [Nitrospirota bacterium]MCL5285295.1 inositol monophosphatase [Nitrospirota bacterium]